MSTEYVTSASAQASEGGWTPSVVVAVIAVAVSSILSAAALFYGRRSSLAARESAAESRRATQVAIEQTELQRQIAIEARGAVVWADIRPHPDARDSLFILVGNTGMSVAHDVRVRIEPPLDGGEYFGEVANKVQSAARSGIASLTPGRTFEWRLGDAREILQSNLEVEQHEMVITWADARGDQRRDAFPIRMGDIWTTSIVQKGSLADVAKAIKDLKSGRSLG